MNLARRLKRIEEKLSIGKEPNPQITVIDSNEELLGPVRDGLLSKNSYKKRNLRAR
jgi:hypothetical protein